VLLFLLLDNGVGHPANLAEIRAPLDVSVLYVPSHISLLQPTDQVVLATFKTSNKQVVKVWTGETKLSRVIGAYSIF
jgi:hypothetical protein